MRARRAAAASRLGAAGFRYPDAIREHILPLIVETMILGGEIKAAGSLL